jgi:hypothetical protein
LRIVGASGPLQSFAMTAFEIYLNGKKLCVAGTGDDGVLSAIVDCVSRSREYRLELAVGGLVSAKQNHLRWENRVLQVGDEVIVRIVETAKVDPPQNIDHHDPAKELEAQKQYVKNAANKFGWKIQFQTLKS